MIRVVSKILEPCNEIHFYPQKKRSLKNSLRCPFCLNALSYLVLLFPILNPPYDQLHLFDGNIFFKPIF